MQRPLLVRAIPLVGLLTLAISGQACDSSKPTTPPADTTSVPFDDFNIVKTTLSDESYGGATDGTNFLVAFATTGDGGATATPAVQMISRTGKVGTPLTFQTNLDDPGVVAFDGTRYLTVFQQGTAKGLSDLYGQFITTAGALSGTPFKITTTGNAPTVFTLTYAGGTYLLTYGRGEFDPATADSALYVMARRIASDGTVGPELIVSTRGFQSDVAYDGTNFLVVYAGWNTNRQAHARFISPAGVLGTDFPISPTNTPVSTPVAVAFNGTTYLAMWGKQIPGTGYDSALVLEPIATDGTLSAPTRVPTSFSLSEVGEIIPVSGGGFYVTWFEADQSQHIGTLGATASTTGAIGTPKSIFAPDTLSNSVVARIIPISGTQGMAMVNRRIHAQWDVYAKLLTLPPP